jgi:hypothetical protein
VGASSYKRSFDKTGFVSNYVYQNLGGGQLFPSLPPCFPSALDFIIAAKHEKTAKNSQLLSQNRKEELSEVSLQGLFCKFFHFHNSK